MSNYLVVGQEAIGYPYVEEMSSDSVGELIHPLGVMTQRWGADMSRLLYQPLAVIDVDNQKAYNFKNSETPISHPDYDSERHAYVYDEEYDIADFILVRRPDPISGLPNPWNDDLTVVDWEDNRTVVILDASDYGAETTAVHNKTVVNLDAPDYSAATTAVTTSDAIRLAEPMFLYRKQDSTIRRLFHTDSDGWNTTTTVHKLHTSSA